MKTPAEAFNEVVVGSKPCAICGELMSRVDFDRQEAFASVGAAVVVAHVRHFCESDGKTPTPDYDANVAKFAKAVAEAEGQVPG